MMTAWSCRSCVQDALRKALHEIAEVLGGAEHHEVRILKQFSMNSQPRTPLATKATAEALLRVSMSAPLPYPTVQMEDCSHGP